MLRKVQGIGVVFGGLACVGLGEAAEFSRPSQPVCMNGHRLETLVRPKDAQRRRDRILGRRAWQL
jgi:hypothetical protein